MPRCATRSSLGWNAAATPSRSRCCCCAIVPALEDRYQVELDEAQVAAATTIGELEGALKGAEAATTRVDTGDLARADFTRAGSPASTRAEHPVEGDRAPTHAPPPRYVYPRW